MATAAVLGGLSKEIRRILDDRTLNELKARGSFTCREMDDILARLDPERFDADLPHLVVALDKLALTRDPCPCESTVHPHGLPGAGRISRRYLKELEHFPTMTRDEETAAAKRLEFARARVEAAECQSRPVRSARQMEYQRLLNEFVERNLHTVVSEVYAYRTYHVSLDDLIQEGNAALIHAAEKFDWRHGVRFRTYLTWWIKQAVERHLAAQKGAVRVPHHLQQKVRRLKREGRLPTGLEGKVTLDQVAKAFDVNPEQASHLISSSRPTFSLEQEIDDDGQRYRDLLVEDWEPRDSERPAVLKNRIRHLLADLDEREQTVLRMRFGLDGRRERTLEEVGTELHLSRERSRQIQQRALRKLQTRLQRLPRVHLEDEI